MEKYKPASGQDIRNILGPVDDETVLAVLRTGASPVEVLQAVEWLEDDDYMGADLQRPMDGSTRRVYEILSEDLDEFEQ